MKRPSSRLGTSCAAGALMLAMLACPVGAKKVTLRYWIWDKNQLPAVSTMVNMFTQRYPNIQVKAEVVPDFGDRLLTVMAAGTGPDVYWINMPTFSVWSRRKMVTDLQPFIDSDKEASATVKAMWKPLVQAYSFKGHMYGLPRDYDTICMLYNEDALRVAGLTAPMNVEKEWTWDTLTTYAKKLTVSQGTKIKQWGFFSTGVDQISWLNFLYSAGGDVFKWNDDGSDEFVMNGSEAEKAFQWLSDKRWKEGVSPDIKTYNSVWPADLFVQGKLAMMMDGDWSLIGYNKSIKNFKWNVAELPHYPKTGKRTTVLHGLADVINPASKNKKEAFTFIKFMASKEAQSVLGKTGTVIPARLDAEGLFFSSKLEPSNRKAYERAVNYSKTIPMSRKVIYQYAAATVQEWVQKIWDGKMTVTAALDGCTRAMTTLIKRYSK